MNCKKKKKKKKKKKEGASQKFFSFKNGHLIPNNIHSIFFLKDLTKYKNDYH